MATDTEGIRESQVAWLIQWRISTLVLLAVKQRDSHKKFGFLQLFATLTVKISSEPDISFYLHGETRFSSLQIVKALKYLMESLKNPH